MYFIVVTKLHEEHQKQVYEFQPGRLEGYEDIFRFTVEQLKKRHEKKPLRFIHDTRHEEDVLSSKCVEGRVLLEGDVSYAGVPGSLLFTDKSQALRSI